MRNFKAYKAYQTAQAQTSSPLAVTIMAHEWCIMQLRFVQAKYGELRFTEADTSLIKTEQVIRELRIGLVTENNVIPEHLREQVLEHAKAIKIVYDWVIEELNYIRMTKNTENLEDVIARIQDLLEADRIAEKNYGK